MPRASLAAAPQTGRAPARASEPDRELPPDGGWAVPEESMDVVAPRTRSQRWRGSAAAAVRAWARVLAVDLRSLAAFRMAVAALLLLDVGWRAWDAAAFVTDEGILPRVVLIEMQPVGHVSGQDHAWSLHFLSGRWWVQMVLHGIAAWFAAWMLFGYRTRLATAASWLLLVSVVNRNPLVSDAGDGVLRCMLFWAMFLPLGARCSVDALRSRRMSSRRAGESTAEPHADSQTGSPEGPVLSFGSAAILLQLLVVYFSAAIYKMDPVWTTELSGVYYALHCDTFVTRWGLVLRSFPVLMQLLTAGTLLLEMCGPVLLLMPLGNRWLRCAMVAAFSLFHMGLAGTMTLGLFPWICIASWLLFLPAEAWQLLERMTAGRGVALRRGWVRWGSHPAWWPRPEDPAWRWRIGREAVAGAFLAYAVCWNALDLVDVRVSERLWPPHWNRVAVAAGMDRGWTMFAPVPHRDDGWPIFRGTLHDGSEVNLWEPGQPLPWEKPPVVSALYHRQRWRRCLENIMAEGYAWHRPYFADWLQRRWDREYALGDPARKVAKVELLRCLEPTPPPGEPFLPLETVTLWTRHYAAEPGEERSP